MNSFVRSFGDWLHDNRVAGYQVDLRARTLTMDTVTEAGAPVTVRFTGLLAHLRLRAGALSVGHLLANLNLLGCF